ncbi:Phage tail protein [Clostridium cavendishii DSM 21758]|uniref:Phage tail protein n=1 Tax=Clostridium cavendishii DSM 21758 TaxID=1121302 RepID=A0A1M6HSR7_9CLOT|nr:phage tail domain-containing protein [Clostridium cavendishii]SHJ25241.1 Phage tail protein [Clostridium cavendishii DSM 21758]
MDNKYLNLKLKWDNNKISIGNNEKYKLVSIEGLEGAAYEVNINKNNQYDGGYIENKRINSREITIVAEFPIIEEAERERQELIKFFNPKKSGVLTVNYGGYERDIVYEVEKFKETRSSLYEPLSFQLDLICPDPYFKDSIIAETINTWIKGWKFKFKLPFKFKQKDENKKNIYNKGHVKTPVEIMFKGPAVNPSVINHRTGEFIKVIKTLTSDDTLFITTEFGNKKVEIESNGIRKNAFNYIDLDSTFFSLEVGDNLIEYNTESLEPQSVEIKYKNRYLGI